MSEDTRCFIDVNSKIRLVRDLEPDMYLINTDKNYISLLADHCGEMVEVDTYDLHSLSELENLLEELRIDGKITR